MLMIPAFQKFKVILGYMEKSRPVWVSVAIQKGGKKGGGDPGRNRRQGGKREGMKEPIGYSASSLEKICWYGFKSCLTLEEWPPLYFPSVNL